MPPLVITKESLYKRITELERKHCCNKNQFFDTFAEFPAEGAAGVLYIDKETEDIYIWNTLNEEYVLLNHTKTANTVYVDGTYGDDTTGQRESRDFPFQTLDAAIAVCETGDLLKVFPGDYTQAVPIATLFNIDCDLGVTWNLGSNMFVNTDFNIEYTVNHSLDVLQCAVVDQYSYNLLNTLGELNLSINFMYKVAFANSVKERNLKVKKQLNVLGLHRQIAPTVNPVSNIEYDYIYKDANTTFYCIGTSLGDNAIANIKVNNLISTSSSTGHGGGPALAYYFGSDVGINKTVSTVVNNTKHDDPNIYVTPLGALDDGFTWRGVSIGTNAGYIFSISQGIRNGTNFNLELNNVKANGFGGLIQLSHSPQNAVIYVKINGVFEKGIPLFTNGFQSAQNCKVIIDMNVECYTSMGLYLSAEPDGSANNNIHSSNQIVVTGRIKTRYTGMSCISIGTGSGASNNTNGTILLKDLTLINDGTVSPIMCAVPENVVIQNVKTNSLITDPNIVEIGESITRNTNYK